MSASEATMAGAEHPAKQVLDSYLLRSLSVAGYAPSFDTYLATTPSLGFTRLAATERSKLAIGDLAYFDWNDNGVPDHVMIVSAIAGSKISLVGHNLDYDYRDLDTLRAVTAGASVVTFDHEHVPTAHLHALAADGIAVRPGPDALVHAQDKAVMRRRLAELDVPCPRNAVVTTTDDVGAFGLPCVLKTTRGGYDGKGVWVVRTVDEAQAAFDAAAAAGVEVLAEELVDFRRELSALVARSPSGQAAAYPIVASTQLDGICQPNILRSV